MAGLSDERHDELCSATLELLVEVGYDRLTMDQVAARARASKATLYRHWADKTSLVADAITRASEELREAATELNDHGSLRADLEAFARDELQRFDETELLQAVLHACMRDPDLAALVRDSVIAQHRAELAVLLGRAVARGEVAPDAPALRFVDEMFAGPLLVGELIRGRPVDQEFLMSYVEAVVLPALGAPPADDTGAAARPGTTQSNSGTTQSNSGTTQSNSEENP